jgi:hypothetical protein
MRLEYVQGVDHRIKNNEGTATWEKEVAGEKAGLRD